MEKSKSKIVDNYQEKIRAEFATRQISLERDELIKLIRELVAEELSDFDLTALRGKDPELLNVKEAASFLNLAVTTLYEKTSRKLIPFHKRDKKLYFNKEELKNWLLGRKSEAVVMKLPTIKKNRAA